MSRDLFQFFFVAIGLGAFFAFSPSLLPRRVSPTDLICFDTFFCLATFIGGSYADGPAAAFENIPVASEAASSKNVEPGRAACWRGEEVRRKENNAQIGRAFGRATKKTD